MDSNDNKSNYMDYKELKSLPSINGVTVIDDKTLSDYGLLPISEKEVMEIEYEVFGYNV